jgi:hypothetical protein
LGNEEKASVKAERELEEALRRGSLRVKEE